MLIGIPASGTLNSVTVEVIRPGLLSPTTLTVIWLTCVVPLDVAFNSIVYPPLARRVASKVPSVPLPVVFEFSVVTAPGFDVGQYFRVPEVRLTPDATVIGTCP